MDNSKKTILSLCSGSGSWEKPYEEAGYNIISVTLPEQDVRMYIPPDDIYGVLAAPPCTEFSLARNGDPTKKPRDFLSGLSVVDACLRIIWRCNTHFWALENPVGMLSRWLGKAPYVFHPWWFGDPWTKRTALWGRFNPPGRLFYKKEDVMTVEQILRCKENRRPQDSGTAVDKARKRAITPSGFASAFFKANQ